MVISVNRRLFRYFGSYSGISVIPVILVNRRTPWLVILRQIPETSGMYASTFGIFAPTANIPLLDYFFYLRSNNPKLE